MTANDQVAIRDLTARFTDAVNRRDSAALAALFTPDGSWVVPGTTVAAGRGEIAARLDGLLANFDRLIQLTHSGHVDVSDETATAVWYITESAADKAGNAFHFTGVYTDALIRTADGWRFAERSFAFLHRTRGTDAGKWYPHPHVIAA
jgi:uncharacterized protein (TIGR02246 family)